MDNRILPIGGMLQLLPIQRARFNNRLMDREASEAAF